MRLRQSHGRVARRAGIAVCAAMLVLPALALSADADEAGGAARAIPYEVAFTQRSFRRYDELVVSPDGGRIAYVVVTPPAERPQTERFSPSGTPVNAVGARIHVIESRSAAPANEQSICPGSASEWNPSWSPDGRQLAFYTDADGVARLWVYDVETGACRRVSDQPIRASVFGGYQAIWSSDGKEVFVPLRPASRSRTDDKPRAPGTPHVFTSGGSQEGPSRAGDITPWLMDQYNSTLAAIDVSSGRARVIVDATAPPAPSTLRLSPSGKWISFNSVIYRQGDVSATYVTDLAIVPAKGGQVRVLQKGLPHSEHRSNYLQPDYRWHPSEDKLIYLYDGALWLVDFDEDVPQAARKLAPELEELAPYFAFFTRDGRSVLVGTDAIGEGRNRLPRALALVPLAGGEPMRLELQNLDGWSVLDVIKAANDVLWQPDQHLVSLQLRHDETGEQAIARIDVRNSRSRIVDRGLHQVSALTSAGAQRELVGIFEDYSTPPDLYRFSDDFSRKRRLTVIDERLSNVQAGSVVVARSRVPIHDGSMQSVRTTVLLPVGARKGDCLPAIVMAYAGSDLSARASIFGGGMGNSIPNLVFTTRGFAVVMPEMPLAPQGQSSDPVRHMTDVLLPQVHQVASGGYVDIERLALSGQSYGGYSTVAIASQTHLFRAGIPINGAFDLAAFYGKLDLETGEARSIGWAEKGQGRMGEDPWANPLRYIRNSPYYQLSQVRTPMLIVSGQADVIVPSEESQRLFVGLRRLEREAELLVYPGEGHSISDWSTVSAVDVSRRIVEFLEKRIGAGARSE